MSEEGSTYLDRILAAKKAQLASIRRNNWNVAELEKELARLPAPLNFREALQSSGRAGFGIGVIAEFKRASPSEGVLRDNADPRAIAEMYAEAGAAAISVLTDGHFHGSLDDLQLVRSHVDLPLLCKDFILHRSQIIDARIHGADAVLLIVSALQPPLLRELVEFARQIGMQVLCEAHNSIEIDRALAVGAEIIGINNRDLRTFELDVERCIALRKNIPRSHVAVAESGIRTRDDVHLLRQAGIDAMLVGTHLMRSEHPGRALIELVSQN